MKTAVLLIYLLFPALLGIARNPEIDSLKSLLHDSHEIDRKIELNYLLSRRYHTIDLSQAKSYAHDALKLTRSSGNREYLGKIYRSLADIAIKEDSISRAKTYCLEATGIFREQQDYYNLAGVLTVLGNIELVRDQLADAMQYYLEAIDLSKKHNLEDFLPVLYLNIGVVNYGFSNYEEAMKNLSGALEKFKVKSDSLNIGNAYYNMGSVYTALNDTAQAYQYLDEARKIFIPIRNYDGIARCNFDMGRLEMMKNNYREAIGIFKSAIGYVNRKNVHYAAPASTILVPSYIALGNCHLALKEISLAMPYYRKGLDLAQLNHRISDIKDASEGISRVWEVMGNIDSSYYYYKIFKAYSDSLSNEDKIKQLAYLNAGYIYEQKLNEERLNSEREAERSRMNSLIYGLVIAGLLLVITIMILLLKLWRNRLSRLEFEQEKLKNELELRNKELTSHVMYQVKKNEFILKISKKLQSSTYNLKPENRKLVEEVVHDIETDFADDAWKEFEVRFHRVHAGFNKKLLEKFPALTPNELRLCAFLRLNMNTKEIAAITYQSISSIDTARHRLRQKLGIGKDDNLIGFLNQF